MKFNKLTSEEERVIVYKGTEMPFKGEYYKHKAVGIYKCKRCNDPLYLSSDKFDANCGWPSFDDEITGAVKKLIDADGRRTEIVCANCDAHLGHVFIGEGFTDKNTRHCVNSISMIFESYEVSDTAIFAAGCFWGVEYYFKKLSGVKEVTSGYIGGKTDNPSYQEVCTGETGHAEAVKVVYDSEKVSYEKLVKYFFEIHNFEQLNRQGPDIGTQYRSAIFVENEFQKYQAQRIIEILKSKGYKVVTTIEDANVFWKAENYHQDYYFKKGSTPYCHSYKKIF
ncbi:MAG: bifunctional methionine sulfoxide reductase B/A protein [Bacteroidetes bacterium]|nr:bifunctional methionine sulfoxide reductase B/A protein [Bacteroidota bacterium]